MKRKALDFMNLLENFFVDYLPHSAGLSENTIRSYKYAFRLLLEYLQEKRGLFPGQVTFSCLDYENVNAFLLWLEDIRGCTASTRNQRLAALSSFASYAQNRNFEAATIYMNAISKVTVKKLTQAPRTIFSLDEVRILLALPNTSTEIGRRDQALLSLMYASGARAQEICDLRVRDVSFQKDGTRLTIMGKGNKTRRILISRPCAEILRKHIHSRRLDGMPDRHLFSSQMHEHMSISCIEEIFKKYIRIAKEENPTLFQEKRYTPHTMRHTCATHMLEAGVPMMAIKNFLGHASISTTERYAELTQGTVNKHIRAWNEKWFPAMTDSATCDSQEDRMPPFLFTR